MALTTYQELRDAVAGWLNRNNSAVVDRVPEFILFGENAIFRRLRSRYNEARLVSPSGNAAGLTLPDNYVSAKLLTWDGRPLVRESDEWFYSKQPSSATQGKPYAFARTEQSKVEFFPPPDADAEVVLTYYEKQGPISNSVTPALFQSFPELYLFAALIEGYPFLQNQDPQDLVVWEAKYARVLSEIEDESLEEEASGSTTSVASPYPDDYGV